MIEKDIEARIVAAAKALGVEGLDVRGAWQTADEGKVKDVESASAPAALFVAVSPRSFETFGLPQVSFDVRLALAVRADLSPDGAALAACAAPVADMLQRWHFAMDCGDDCGLGVEGAFVPGGLQLSGGTAPEYDEGACVWSVTFNISLRGVAVAAETELGS